ncbi:MAG: biopolymer transporter ExbD [Verrucomicrobia bacterium]|nr:biopolymer transporter ExbD [Verrucomicrobiota bacterium]MDA1088117.1 biopolymer transporter ExbD [Verrucomicrobiota bacterium]
MKRRKPRDPGKEGELEMTPMIDVVFQLLIFFLVTLKPEDIIAQLDVSRPSPDSTPPVEQPQDMITITIGEVIDMNGRVVSLATLEKTLIRLASYSTSQTVLVKCTLLSMHEKLVQVLDKCSKAGLTNISVFTI